MTPARTSWTDLPADIRTNIIHRVSGTQPLQTGTLHHMAVSRQWMDATCRGVRSLVLKRPDRAYLRSDFRLRFLSFFPNLQALEFPDSCLSSSSDLTADSLLTSIAALYPTLEVLRIGHHCGPCNGPSPSALANLFRRCPGLKELRCENLGPRQQLPEELGHLTGLTSLSLACKYSEPVAGPRFVLPESVTRLTALKELSLHAAGLFHLPPGMFAALSELTVLKIWCSELLSLPPDFTSLQGLECLHLFAPKLTALPHALSRLSSLPELMVCVSCQADVQRVFTDLPSLRCLKVIGRPSTGMRELPEALSLYTALESLDLSLFFYLQSLPESLCLLPGLTASIHSNISPSACAATAAPGMRLVPGTSRARLSPFLGFLSNALDAFSGLHTLDISNCPSLCSLPKALGSLHTLSNLFLVDCPRLTAIPDSICSMRALDSLALNNLGISCLPESFGQLPRLKTLRLCYCLRLRQLPDSVGRLSVLQLLEITDCHALRRLPDSFGQLKCLQQLSIDTVGIQSLPDTLVLLPALQRIYLSELHHLKQLPAEFDRLSQLTSLDITNCASFQRLPDDFGRLPALVNLTLSKLGLQSLPFPLTLPCLTQLTLELVMRLEVVPDFTEGELMSLRRLTLERFHGGALSQGIGQIRCLTELRINRCKNLKTLPASIGQLEWLDQLHVSSCPALRRLPETIGALSRLRVLHLFDVSLDSLPESIARLTGLQSLSLHSAGRFPRLPQPVLRLTALQNLFIASTCLVELPGNLHEMRSLRKLELELHSLRVLPETLGRMGTLTCLILYGCPNLQSLPESMTQLVGLQELQLRKCPALVTLPLRAGQLPGSCKLIVSACPNLEIPTHVVNAEEREGMDMWEEEHQEVEEEVDEETGENEAVGENVLRVSRRLIYDERDDEASRGDTGVDEDGDGCGWMLEEDSAENSENECLSSRLRF